MTVDDQGREKAGRNVMGYDDGLVFMQLLDAFSPDRFRCKKGISHFVEVTGIND